MTDSPSITPHPLDHPGVIRLRLGKSASDVLLAAGKYLFAAVTPGDCTTPEAAGHAVLYCITATKEQLDGAFGIIAGTHRATRIKPAKP